MTALPLLLCSLALAAEPPPPPPPAGGGSAPPTWAAPGAPGPEGPGGEPAARHAAWSVGLEALLPKKTSGRLLEQPLALKVEARGRLARPLEGVVQFGLGYAQLSRTEACLTAACDPLLGVSMGIAIHATTAPDADTVGWIALGVGMTGAANWELNVVGGYGRVDAGVALAIGPTLALRLSVGWVAAAYTEDRAELEPGPQQYLAITVAVGGR
jgi:hypothetical protein